MSGDTDEIKHSKFGVASFLIGIGIFISAVVLVLINWVFENKIDNVDFSMGFAVFTLYYVLFFAPAAHFIGLILGCSGCLQNKRRKVLAIAGIVVNLLFIFIHIGFRSYFSLPPWGQ
jgi:accessory gene regulator protein AgrB